MGAEKSYASGQISRSTYVLHRLDPNLCSKLGAEKGQHLGQITMYLLLYVDGLMIPTCCHDIMLWNDIKYYSSLVGGPPPARSDLGQHVGYPTLYRKAHTHVERENLGCIVGSTIIPFLLHTRYLFVRSMLNDGYHTLLYLVSTW